MKDKSEFLRPKNDITFKCDGCSHIWDGEPEKVDDAPELSHPYRYYASCPKCADVSQQIPWQRGLFSSYVKSTGPKSSIGKAKSAANLEGHPTAEEAQRTRFNAMKHGANAQTAMFFPAKPDKYAFCKMCDVDRDYCAAQPACIRRTELFMRHMIAIQSGDTGVLKEMHAVQQANLASMFDDMLISVISEGVLLKTPAYSFDKDGGFHLAKYKDPETGENIQIMDAKANPLLKHVFDLMSKNNYSLADLGMTNKVQAAQETEMGRLHQEEVEKIDAGEFKRKQQETLENLQSLIAKSRDRKERDPVLIEYNEQNGDG